MKTRVVKQRLNSQQRRQRRNERRAKARHYNIHLYFILIAAAIILGTLGIATALSFLVREWLSMPMQTLPMTAWVCLFVVLVSVADTLFLSKTIFEPIARLGQAMNRVAEGDFNVQLDTGSKIVELRDGYRSFNRMVEELAMTETMQTDFVSHVSHEFRTPLAAIEGYATLLQDEAASDEERAQYAERILLSTRRLSVLVGDVLLLSKTERRGILPPPISYRLDEQVREALLAQETAWTERQIEFDVELCEVTYEGQESLLYHVFSNLISNAVKYAPMGGQVRLSLSEEAETVTFTVEDNGPGIPEEERTRIFRKFYRADGARSSSGNGLGLALVKNVLETVGGQIAVSDVQPHGARFTVTLPKRAKDGAHMRARRA